MEEAITRHGAARAARCGVIRTKAVSRVTTFYLVRVRYLLEQPERTPLLAEEVQILGHEGKAGSRGPEWLPANEALRLLAEAKPDANVPMAERRELVADTIAAWAKVEPALRKQMEARAAELVESHRRVRQAVALKVRSLDMTPQFPPDLLGLLVLQPVVAEGSGENGAGSESAGDGRGKQGDGR
jgi:hypothetical protein